MRSVAISVGADEGDPGGPGPVYADGTFAYVPAPEPDSTVARPTYAELGLADLRPSNASDTVAEMNPTFPEIAMGTSYTYGREPSEAAHRIAELSEGDVIFFYTQLAYDGRRLPLLEKIDVDVGYYLIGQLTLASDPVLVEGRWSIPRSVWQAFETNALRRRQTFDARVLVRGDPVRSGLYERVLPLDGPNLSREECLPRAVASAIDAQSWGDRPVVFETDETEHLLRVAAGGRQRRAVA